MKHNWKYKRLEDISNINMGQSPNSSFYNENGEGLPFFQGCADFGEKYPVTKKYCRLPLKTAEADDILFSVRAPIGTMNYAKEKCCIGRGLCSINTLSAVLQNYLFYVLDFSKPKIIEQGRGSTFKSVGKDIIANHIIPVPPLDVQKQIIAELDKINEIISDCNEAIRNLDNLATSLFYDYFSDAIINHNKHKISLLNNLCTVTSSNRIFADEYCENGIPFYRGKEVSELSRGENISTELYISKERYELLKTSNNIPQMNDILITAVGTIGNIWIVNSTKPFYFKDGNIIWLKDIDYTLINSVYFKFFLNKLIQDEKEKMANGSAYKALTIQKLKKINVILPPPALQQKFAACIEQIDQQKKGVEKTIANMQTLLDSRMDYWFN